MKRIDKPGIFVIAVTLLQLAGVNLARAQGSGPEWTMFGSDVHNTRHAVQERRLSPQTVGSLRMKWAFSTRGDISANVAVAGGAVYVPDWGGYFHKIDARTGQGIWSVRVSDYDGVPNSVSRTSPLIVGNLVIIGGQSGAYLMAIDTRSGALVWKTQLDPHPGAIITQSPVAFGNRIFVGLSSIEEVFAADPSYPCCSFRGSLTSVDANTGRILWKTYSVPEGYSGGAVWGSAPVIDTRRQAVYFTTGNNYSVPPDVDACADAAGDAPARDACLASDNYIDAIVALDLRTGAVRWGRRLQGFDAWTVACTFLPPGVTWCPSPTGEDYDFGQGASLFTVNRGGRPQQLIGAGQKSGVYWALDPDTGEVVWNTLVGPGGALGGIMWGSAVDGQRVYVALSNYYRSPYQLQPSGVTSSWGSFAALDAATGAFLWQIADPTPGAIDMGPVTVANGVVFAGSMDPAGHMYALDAATGQVLWSFASGASVLSGAAVVDGTVYWGSGYFRFGLGTPGNRLYAFEIP